MILIGSLKKVCMAAGEKMIKNIDKKELHKFNQNFKPNVKDVPLRLKTIKAIKRKKARELIVCLHFKCYGGRKQKNINLHLTNARHKPHNESQLSIDWIFFLMLHHTRD